MVLFSALAVMSFSCFSKKMTPPTIIFSTHNKIDNYSNDSNDCDEKVTTRINKASGNKVSFCGFLVELFCLLDIMNSLELEEDGDEETESGGKKWVVGGGDVEAGVVRLQKGIEVNADTPGTEEQWGKETVCGVKENMYEPMRSNCSSSNSYDGDLCVGSDRKADMNKSVLVLLEDIYSPKQEFVSDL